MAGEPLSSAAVEAVLTVYDAYREQGVDTGMDGIEASTDTTATDTATDPVSDTAINPDTDPVADISTPDSEPEMSPPASGVALSPHGAEVLLQVRATAHPLVQRHSRTHSQSNITIQPGKKQEGRNVFILLFSEGRLPRAIS